MKKIAGLIILTLLLSLCSAVSYAYGINVYIDGVPVQFDNSSGYPFAENGRTLVPLRATMESFGATVAWEAETSTAIVYKDTTTVRCEIGKNYIYRNNVKIENDAAAVVRDQRTYLPIRVVLESFGATVAWDGSVKVTGQGDGLLINQVENTPSVTKNYWSVWNEAIAQKGAGNYTEAINKILSISSQFIKENDGASSAMLYKHLGECYSNLCDYSKAAMCFRREASYWDKTPGMKQSSIDAVRRANLIKTGTQIYVKSTDKDMGGRIDFGVKHEPDGGIYLGAYAENDTKIYDPYNPSKFYIDTFPGLVGKDSAAYLLYIPYGTDITIYDTHIKKAIAANKILQISLEPRAGLYQVNGNDGYLIKLAMHMENSGCKMMLRFAGEMNDQSSMWYTENTALFIEKFRTVAEVFHKYAPSVPVIWAPNHFPADTMADYYPGDEYVDYVGLSSYMMHETSTDPLGQGIDRSRWSNQLDKLYSLYGHKKPIIIVEGGASYMDYTTWADITPFASTQLKDFYTYLPIKYPNVKMCFIFDADRERQKFSLSNNNTYLAAYKQGISSDLFVGNINNSGYKYDYYEIGNNVAVKAEKTELCSYVITPTNDVAYVIYYLNGTYLGTVNEAPYKIGVDFSGYKNQQVTVTCDSYDSIGNRVTTHSVRINVR